MAWLHLACALPRLSSAVEVVSDLIAEYPVVDPVEIGPTATPPDGPGIGVDLDDGLF